MSKDDKKTPGEIGDVLDQIKEIERMVKAQTLIKILSTLKQNAREILELKEETTALLEELGISETDSKRIIDFINNSSEVQLTEKDKKDIREEVKTVVSAKKKISQEEFEKKFHQNSYFQWNTTVPAQQAFGGSTVTYYNNGNGITKAGNSGTYNLMCDNTSSALALFSQNGNELEIVL